VAGIQQVFGCDLPSLPGAPGSTPSSVWFVNGTTAVWVLLGLGGEPRAGGEGKLVAYRGQWVDAPAALAALEPEDVSGSALVGLAAAIASGRGAFERLLVALEAKDARHAPMIRAARTSAEKHALTTRDLRDVATVLERAFVTGASATDGEIVQMIRACGLGAMRGVSSSPGDLARGLAPGELFPFRVDGRHPALVWRGDDGVVRLYDPTAGSGARVARASIDTYRERVLGRNATWPLRSTFRLPR
jgi:hypothetical protein